MEYIISSKIYTVGLWFITVFFLLLDSLAYIVVIIPGLVDFGLFEGMVFLFWFIGKVAILACLVFRRGPLKLAIFSVLLPLIVYGLYCSLIFPLTSSVGYGINTLLNTGIAFIALMLGVATHKFVTNEKNGI